MSIETAIFDNKVVQNWWDRLQLSEAELQEKNSTRWPGHYRPQLQRCKTWDQAMLTDGFRALWFALVDAQENHHDPESQKCRWQASYEAWATVAMVLSHLRKSHRRPFGLTMAGANKDNKTQKIVPDTNERGEKRTKPIVSDLRLHQLLAANDETEFAIRMIRTIKLVDATADPLEVACDILQWFRERDLDYNEKGPNRLAVRWGMHYYNAYPHVD